MSDDEFKLAESVRVRGKSIEELAEYLYSRLREENPSAGSVFYGYTIKEIFQGDDEGTLLDETHESINGEVPLDKDSIAELLSSYQEEGKIVFYENPLNGDDLPSAMPSTLEISVGEEPGVKYVIEGIKEGKSIAYFGLLTKEGLAKLRGAVTKAKQSIMNNRYIGGIIRSFLNQEQRERVKERLKEGLRKANRDLNTLATTIGYVKEKPFYMDIGRYEKKDTKVISPHPAA